MRPWAYTLVMAACSYCILIDVVILDFKYSKAGILFLFLLVDAFIVVNCFKCSLAQILFKLKPIFTSSHCTRCLFHFLALHFADLKPVNKSSKVLGLLDLEMSSEVGPLEVSSEIASAM